MRVGGLAAAEGHLESVRFLLEHNISPNTADRWGGTPLDDAELAGHSDVIALLRQHEAVNGNSQHIASDSGPTERADQHGDSESIVELLWAAAENDVEGLRRFVAQGVPISASDYDGRTVLHTHGQCDLACGKGGMHIGNGSCNFEFIR